MGRTAMRAGFGEQVAHRIPCELGAGRLVFGLQQLTQSVVLVANDLPAALGNASWLAFWAQIALLQI